MQAQDHIIDALIEQNAKCAAYKQQAYATGERRAQRLKALLRAVEMVPSLQQKLSEALLCYQKLLESADRVHKALAELAAQSETERAAIAERHRPPPPPPPPPPVPTLAPAAMPSAYATAGVPTRMSLNPNPYANPSSSADEDAEFGSLPPMDLDAIAKFSLSGPTSLWQPPATAAVKHPFGGAPVGPGLSGPQSLPPSSPPVAFGMPPGGPTASARPKLKDYMQAMKANQNHQQQHLPATAPPPQQLSTIPAAFAQPASIGATYPPPLSQPPPLSSSLMPPTSQPPPIQHIPLPPQTYPLFPPASQPPSSASYLPPQMPNALPGVNVQYSTLPYAHQLPQSNALPHPQSTYANTGSLASAARPIPTNASMLPSASPSISTSYAAVAQSFQFQSPIASRGFISEPLRAPQPQPPAMQTGAGGWGPAATPQFSAAVQNQFAVRPTANSSPYAYVPPAAAAPAPASAPAVNSAHWPAPGNLSLAPLMRTPLAPAAQQFVQPQAAPLPNPGNALFWRQAQPQLQPQPPGMQAFQPFATQPGAPPLAQQQPQHQLQHQFTQPQPSWPQYPPQQLQYLPAVGAQTQPSFSSRIPPASVDDLLSLGQDPCGIPAPLVPQSTGVQPHSTQLL